MSKISIFTSIIKTLQTQHVEAAKRTDKGFVITHIINMC